MPHFLLHVPALLRIHKKILFQQQAGSQVLIILIPASRMLLKLHVPILAETTRKGFEAMGTWVPKSGLFLGIFVGSVEKQGRERRPVVTTSNLTLQSVKFQYFS